MLQKTDDVMEGGQYVRSEDFHNQPVVSNSHPGDKQQTSTKLQKTDNKPPPTLLDIASSVRSPVVLTAINQAFIDITINFILSIRRLNLTPTIVIVCEDRKSYDVLSQWENITTVMTHLELSNSDAKNWRSKAYNQLVDKRVPYIIELLKNGKDVFFMDTDIVWLADPFPYVSGNLDIAVIHDYPENKENKIIYCAGYAFFRNTAASRFVVYQWQRQLVSPQRKEGSEQQGKFNKALKKGKGRSGKQKLKLKVLPRNLFQAGFEFFNSSTPLEDRPIRPVMIHNNWIVGLQPKLERYKKYGLWYLETD